MDKKIKALSNKAVSGSKQMDKVLAEIQKTIVGQKTILKKIILALIADGHILLEGVPGLAKTMMIKTLSDTLHADFCRIQFTPDLLPADIIGTKIYNHKNGSFTTKKGPIFANFILADEINRAPPKVQSALLEAMQEKQVSISGDTFKLERPFLVMATQNPLETEGTYRLPEAQVDRFMMKILIDYPEREEEKEIMTRMTEGMIIKTSKILKPKMISDLQKFCQEIYADDTIKDYVSHIVEATRRPHKYKLDVDGLIEYGASPRASIWLILGAKANALLDGRGYVKPEDVKEVAHDVLRHRIILSYEAEAEDMTSDDIIAQILKKVKVP